MISPLLGLMLLVQGTTAPSTATAPPAPLHLKDSIHDFPRSMLQPKVSGPISIDLSRSSRASYQTLADIAGLNILFDPDFRDSSITPTHLDNVDIFEAFDRVSDASKSFVEVLDSKTIVVASDNANKRRSYELQVIKTIYLTNIGSPQDPSGPIMKLRTLNFRYLATYAEMKAIVVRDSPDRVAAAEKLLAESDKTNSSEPIAFDSAGNLLIPDRGGIKKSSPSRSKLQVGSAGPTAIDMNDDARTTFQALAGMAGLNVLFDQDFRSPSSVSLKLENADVLDALDLLGYETRTLWDPVGSKTILIAPDNQTKRRDYDQLLIKTIYLGSSATQSQATEIVTALRTLLNMRYLAQVSGVHAIAMMETPTKIALAEKIIEDLGMGGALQGNAGRGITLEVGDETGGLLRSRAVRSLAPAVSQLNLKGAATISVDMNGTTRESFERVAGMAGLHVTFDERFKDGAAQPFSVSDVSVLDALDFLSLQSKTFWEVLDSTTILVAPDSQAVRRDLEPTAEKVIPLRNTPTEGGAREIVIALRTLLNIRDIKTGDKAIVIIDDIDRIALAEKIVADLDR